MLNNKETLKTPNQVDFQKASWPPNDVPKDRRLVVDDNNNNVGPTRS